MGNHEKKSESNDESEQYASRKYADALWLSLLKRIEKQEERILALEKAMIEVKHTNTDDGSRHRNDGGWFD